LNRRKIAGEEGSLLREKKNDAPFSGKRDLDIRELFANGGTPKQKSQKKRKN